MRAAVAMVALCVEADALVTISSAAWGQGWWSAYCHLFPDGRLMSCEQPAPGCWSAPSDAATWETDALLGWLSEVPSAKAAQLQPQTQVGAGMCPDFGPRTPAPAKAPQEEGNTLG